MNMKKNCSRVQEQKPVISSSHCHRIHKKLIGRQITELDIIMFRQAEVVELQPRQFWASCEAFHALRVVDSS